MIVGSKVTLMCIINLEFGILLLHFKNILGILFLGTNENLHD